MKVNAEIRDFQILHIQIRKNITPIIIWFLIVCIDFIFIANRSKIPHSISSLSFIILLVLLIAFIPLIILLVIRAHKSYNESWITKQFDFIVLNRHVYYNEQQMFVSYNKVLNRIYVHNMDKKLKATFYATVKEPDVYSFLEYLNKNEVIFDEEELPASNRKLSDLRLLGMRKYRR